MIEQLAADFAADNLPRLAQPKLTIAGNDGTAAVWLHPGDADTPATVQLDVRDGAISDPALARIGITLEPHQALAIARALADVAGKVLRARHDVNEWGPSIVRFVKIVPAAPAGRDGAEGWIP